MLEIAAAEGAHACRLGRRGLEVYIVEPSPTMLERARGRVAEYGVQVRLVRGIAETLPFPDATFDRVVCDSALDHLADPERAIREMSRVTTRDGRVVLTFVNYGSASTRLSRLVYRAGRRLGLLRTEAQGGRLFWDSPVPHDHNFECTLENVSAMCRPYLELDRAAGISLGWNVPGWGRLLARFGGSGPLLRGLDRIARAGPQIADFVVSVWRPRPRTMWPADELCVRPSNPVYQRQVREEVAYRARAAEITVASASPASERTDNAAMTGDPGRAWLTDLIARGTFRDAAALGCDEPRWVRDWLASGGSERLDVYEVGDTLVTKARAALGAASARVRFIPMDLNFAQLPAGAYDVVWTSGGLHAVVNLEHLFSQVHQALRPGGLFAVHGYVGERRLQYDPRRLARINAVLAGVPARYRRTETVAAPAPPWEVGPLCAVRSDEILALARARFDVVHEATTGRLFPLGLAVDRAAIARDEPRLLDRLAAAEDAARDDPLMQPCLAYAVFRRRAGA